MQPVTVTCAYMIIVDGKLDLCPCSRKHRILVNNLYTICPLMGHGVTIQNMYCAQCSMNPCIFSSKADDFYCQPFGQAACLCFLTRHWTLPVCVTLHPVQLSRDPLHMPTQASIEWCGIFHLKLVFVCVVRVPKRIETRCSIYMQAKVAWELRSSKGRG